MKWSIHKARDGNDTLSLNDVFLYSKFRPIDEVRKWLLKEINEKASSYLVIGLGLGYHVQQLKEITDKIIYVYYFDEREIEMANILSSDQICLINDLNEVATDGLQILLSTAWVSAIGENHPLYVQLETIKMFERSFKLHGNLMLENYYKNITQNLSLNYPKPRKKIACLISAGPSSEETLMWLKNYENYVDIYSVGAALNICNYYGIEPTAVVITDSQEEIAKQIIDYEGPLFFLLTASAKAVRNHNGIKYPLCQEGYLLSEKFADENNLPKLLTGGSVATTAFSLIQYLKYEKIIFFGQDLGFCGENTHAIHSLSNKKNEKKNLLIIKANDGSEINTNLTLNMYLTWFNKHCKESHAQVFTTALKGAKIAGVKYIDQKNFYNIIMGKDLV